MTSVSSSTVTVVNGVQVWAVDDAIRVSGTSLISVSSETEYITLRGQSNQSVFLHPEGTIFVVIKLKKYIYLYPP